MSQTPSQADTMHRVVQTTLPFARAVAAFESELGLWHLDGARKAMREGVSRADLDAYIGTMSGPHGLMVLATTDQGEVVSFEGRERACTLYLVGNPSVATQIIDIDIRAAFLVPFRVALYEDDASAGTAIAYDLPSALLASLGRPELDSFGASLDTKMATVVDHVIAKG